MVVERRWNEQNNRKTQEKKLKMIRMTKSQVASCVNVIYDTNKGISSLKHIKCHASPQMMQKIKKFTFLFLSLNTNSFQLFFAINLENCLLLWL